MKNSIVGKLLSFFGEKEKGGGCVTVHKKKAADVSVMSAEDNRELIKKLKGRLRRNRIIAVVLLGLACGLAVFAMNFEVALPYDPDRMLVECVPATFVYNDAEGFEEYEACDLDGLTFEQTKDMLDGKYKAYDLPRIVDRSVNVASVTSRERTVERDGEEVLVIYFCMYKTVWDTLFFGDLLPFSDSGSCLSSVFAERFSERDGTYRPIQTEFYYLQDKILLDPDNTDVLSDAEYDALRKRAALMWKGVC